jgi:hypothetical protein
MQLQKFYSLEWNDKMITNEEQVSMGKETAVTSLGVLSWKLICRIHGEP